MGKRTIVVILAVMVLGVGLIIALARWQTGGQPSYHGRALGSWLRTLDDGDHDPSLPWQPWTDPTAGKTEAVAAIRAMGTNSLPFLMSALTNRDSEIKTVIITFLKKTPLLKFPISSVEDYRRGAALALHILGPAAKPVVPQLTAALDDNWIGKPAALALAGIGPEGWTVLTKELNGTNRGWAPVCAVWALGSHRATVPGTIPALLAQIQNTNRFGGAGAISAWALGEIGQDSAEVVPALITGLQSTQSDIRFSCANSLGEFGANAESALPALSNAVNDADSQVSTDAATSLKLINRKVARVANVK